MPENLPVVAAIPNYNMGDYLLKLLPRLLTQGYDRVYVLDDASTDHSVDVVAEFGSDVTLVRSGVNKGASANRNQIIDQVDNGVLIHFVDADMDLITSDTAAVAREVMARHSSRGVGAVGGLISRSDGTQLPHNFGPSFSFRAALTSWLPLLIDHYKDKPRLAAGIRTVTSPVMKNWPYVVEPPFATPTYWFAEGNALIYSDVLRSVGGFDATMREHEVQDFAIRLERMGVKRYFDPSIEVVHHHVDVRGRSRPKKQLDAALHIIRKHGVRRFLTD